MYKLGNSFARLLQAVLCFPRFCGQKGCRKTVGKLWTKNVARTALKSLSENLSESVGKKMCRNHSHRSTKRFSDKSGSTPIFILPIWTQDFRKGNLAVWPTHVLWISGSPSALDPWLPCRLAFESAMRDQLLGNLQ